MSGMTPVAAHMIRAFDRGTKVTCVWSGWGCGKTQGLLELAFYACHSRRVINKKTGEQKPATVLICAESLPKLEGSSLKLSRELFEGVKGSRFVNKSGRPTWHFANGSMITFRGFEVYPNGKCSVEGEEHILVVGDESQEMHDAWTRISRARARAQNISIATGRTYTGQVAWVGYPQSDDRYLRAAKALAAKGTSVEFLHYRSSSNAWLPADYEEERRADFATVEEWEAVCQIRPGLTFPARNSYYGDVVAPTSHREGGSLIDLPVDRTIPTTVSIDPGNESYSALFWQTQLVDGRPRRIIVDEWHAEGMTTDRAAIDAINARGFNLDGVILDPFAGNQRSRHADGLTTLALMQRGVDDNPDGRGGGFGCDVLGHLGGDRSSVKQGIDRTRARFCDVDGNRAILIRRALWEQPESDRGLRFAVQNYAPDPATGQPLKKRGSASEVASHCADALRYGVAGTDLWYGPPQLDTPAPPPRRKPRPTRAARLVGRF